jgi:hypothetical protein
MSHYTPWRCLRERWYSSYSITTSALDGGEWSASRPGRTLAPGKEPLVPIVQEAGWAPEPVWTQRLEEKSFRLCWGSNLDRPVVQPVARHYTDCSDVTVILYFKISGPAYGTGRSTYIGLNHSDRRRSTLRLCACVYLCVCVCVCVRERERQSRVYRVVIHVY